MHTGQIKCLFTRQNLALLGAVSLAGCASAPVPLDPLIGDTGQPLSAVAQKADVKYYALDLEIFPENQSISGVGQSEFLILAPTTALELKLDSRFTISQITVDAQPAEYSAERGVITIALGRQAQAGERVKVAVHYAGQPHVALKAPWAGGTVWSHTENGTPWIATAVQGEGCDLFWPCKDHFSDKADSMRIQLTVPKGLSAVTNGVLQSVETLDNGKQRFDWLLSVPTSDYNIALNIGPYARVQTSYTSVNGSEVPIEFWALQENADKASALIENDLRQQMAFFEQRLGPYPWGNQKLGFVETPHLGMEHQTINAYGKKYARDEYGYDWLLQHELAHEWFGNLVTHQALNDAWIHEGFGTYMQPAYALDKFGSAAYNYQMYKAYLGLMNCAPIVLEGTVTSNEAFNPDIYGKGSWTLHTLRWLIGEEHFWQATRELLYSSNQSHSLNYPIQPVYRNTQDFMAIVERISGQNYDWLFNVYLKLADLPELNIEKQNERWILRWQTEDQRPFPMPLPVEINGQLNTYQVVDGKIELPVKATDKVIIDPQMQVLRYLPIIGKCEENLQKRKKR